MAPITWRAEAICELAVSALKVGDCEKAAALCINAIKIKPEFAEAFHIRGICLLREQRPFDALMHFDRALQINPDQYDCWNNRGIAFAEIGMWDAARDCFQQSLQRMRASEPHIMCGGMYAHLMKLEEAEREFLAAVEIEPQLQDARLKLGVIQLGLGKWADGFANYQWRWFDTPHPPRAYRSFPQWRGEDLAGKTILLFSEQGFGDEIMALRFIEDVRLMARRVLVEVRPTMMRIARSLDVELVAHGDPYPSGIDYSCPLLDVPMVLGMTPDTVPRPVSYLSVPPSDAWRERLGKLEGRKIGLCWSSGRRPLQTETQKSMAAKSIVPKLLAPLMEVEDVSWVSLQVPREDVPREYKIVDYVDHIDDFYDTAQLMRELDLIITVDTAVAHLAGALGLSVWNLVRFNGYWPWLTPGRETLWYPSMRVFRQPELGDWLSIIDKVKSALQEHIHESAFLQDQKTA